LLVGSALAQRDVPQMRHRDEAFAGEIGEVRKHEPFRRQ